MAKHDNKLISHSHPKTSWPGAYAAVCAIIIAIVINGVGNAEPYDEIMLKRSNGFASPLNKELPSPSTILVSHTPRATA